MAANSEKTAKKKGGPGAPFKPGQSGNPSGRPKKTEEQRTLEAMCREKTPEAVDVVLHIMLNGENERSRLAAAEIVLERGHGKPVDRQEQGKPGDFSNRDELLAGIKERALKLGVVIPKLKQVA